MAEKNTFFTGRIALITGGSSGIGLALAKDLAAQGARVWIAGRREEKLYSACLEVRAETGATCNFLPADVSDPTQAERLVREVTEREALPDLLINSAGITRPGYVQDLDLDIFRQMMEVNYFGTVNVIKAALPGMIERGEGHIVNIASLAGFGGVFGYSAYGASKYAVRGFSDVLRSEMKPLGIRVSVVFPADTDTPQLEYEKQYQPFETRVMNAKAKMMTAEEVARAILKGVQKNKYIILPGFDVKLLYFINDLLGNAKYSLVDWWIRDARRKAGKQN